ncbi:unknown [Odoribacter sp. CAG:788]|nr:unknown [Odoribacter sp. CAG:788]
MPFGRFQTVIFRNQIYTRSDFSIFFNRNAAPVHENTGLIDEYVFTYSDKLTEIGIERQTDHSGFIDFGTQQTDEVQSFLRFVVRGVEFARYDSGMFQGFLHFIIFGVVQRDGFSCK